MNATKSDLTARNFPSATEDAKAANAPDPYSGPESSSQTPSTQRCTTHQR